VVRVALTGRTAGLVGLVVVLVTAGCLGVTGTSDGELAPAEPAATSTAVPGTTSSTPGSMARLGTPVPSAEPQVTVTVVEVVDGDTVKIRYPDGTRETVRLLGVDTPEVRGEPSPGEFEGVPDTDEGRQCLRRYGEAASQYATDRLLDREVGLGFDEAEGQRGYYGRLLAYVYVDGEQFNLALVSEGYARMYDSRFVEGDRYAAAETAARSADRGVWSCAPSRGSGADEADAFSVVTVHADAAGPDGENLADEYVVVRNGGDAPLDLSGWTVADAAGHVYEFPDGATIGAGETIRVRTGDGSDGGGDYYWDAGRPVWNNGGDTVTVRDASGVTVTTHSY
jgi:micrococcal nuclease